MKGAAQRQKIQSRQDEQTKWQRYEVLKARYTALAASSSEYEAACRRAANESGV